MTQSPDPTGHVGALASGAPASANATLILDCPLA
jgi:hypothetical protein